MKFALTFGIGAAVLLALDFIWLSSTGNSLYRPAMGSLMRAKPDLVPAAIFYVLYAFGLCYLVVYPALFGPGSFSYGGLALKAAVFGLVAYATYNLTGLSVITGWPLGISLIDMTWGTVVTTVTASATAFLLKMMGQAG